MSRSRGTRQRWARSVNAVLFVFRGTRVAFAYLVAAWRLERTRMVEPMRPKTVASWVSKLAAEGVGIREVRDA
jgi:hypothetical protein